MMGPLFSCGSHKTEPDAPSVIAYLPFLFGFGAVARAASSFRATRRLHSRCPAPRRTHEPLERLDDPDDATVLDDGRLTLLHAAAAAVVRLRFYAGLSVDEAAKALGTSPRSAARLWTYARAVLFWPIGVSPMNPNPRMLFVAFLASIGLMVLPARRAVHRNSNSAVRRRALDGPVRAPGCRLPYRRTGCSVTGQALALPLHSPTHTYTTPGQYTVYWSWTDYWTNLANITWGGGSYAGGGGSFLITVNPPVSASFTASPTSGAAPLAVSFTDTSSGQPTSWSWAFGDGTTSTAQNPTHAYSAPGNYSVTLVASNAGASNTLTKYGYIS